MFSIIISIIFLGVVIIALVLISFAIQAVSHIKWAVKETNKEFDGSKTSN